MYLCMHKRNFLTPPQGLTNIMTTFYKYTKARSTGLFMHAYENVCTVQKETLVVGKFGEFDTKLTLAE